MGGGIGVVVLGWWYWGLLGVIGVGGGIGVVLGGWYWGGIGVVLGGSGIGGRGKGEKGGGGVGGRGRGGTAPVSHDVVSSSSDLWVL